MARESSPLFSSTPVASGTRFKGPVHRMSPSPTAGGAGCAGTYLRLSTPSAEAAGNDRLTHDKYLSSSTAQTDRPMGVLPSPLTERTTEGHLTFLSLEDGHSLSRKNSIA